MGERESSGINRELKEMGPQADEGGEQVLITDGVHTENTDDTDVRRRTGAFAWESVCAGLELSLVNGYVRNVYF